MRLNYAIPPQVCHGGTGNTVGGSDLQGGTLVSRRNTSEKSVGGPSKVGVKESRCFHIRFSLSTLTGDPELTNNDRCSV